VAIAIAAAMRIDNALRYRTRMGFDAVENFEYVRKLLVSWTLPPPDASWATSHPPLFYYASAAIGRGLAAVDLTPALVWVVPLCSSALGFAAAWAVYQLVLRTKPDAEPQAWLAALLVLFAPVHVYMSAMFSEEILASTLSSLAIVAAALFTITIPSSIETPSATPSIAMPSPQGDARPRLAAAAAIGALAGLAWLTKLSGVLALAAIFAAWAISAWRLGRWRSAVAPLAALALAGVLLGGWFYARNLATYGYIYPQDLSVHAIMFEMPPGERGVFDYVYLPFATWTDPQLLNADLLKSVWGSTFATLWFDGHRHFLPHSVAASHAGSALLMLALVPTAAFAVGALRGARRWWADPSTADGPLLALLLFTLVGYVAFTASNPWFATLKGSYMLGAVVPFAFYTSEGLMGWMSGGGWRAKCVGAALVALFIGVTLVFSIGLVFTKIDATGLPWRTAA